MKNHTDVLIAGDTHGNIPHLDYLLGTANDFDCTAVLVVGDFGYWEHAPDGAEFLDGLAEMIRISGIPIYWIDGNHDNHRWLLDHYEPLSDGTYEVRPDLFYLPRGYSWEWGGKRWLALGGGNSIDKAWRIREERKRGFPLWWESEAIIDADVDVCLKQPKAAIMVTHDAPSSVDITWQFHRMGSKGINTPPEFLANRKKIQRVVDYHEPEILFHGHLHIPYTDTPYEGAPKVVALANEMTATGLHTGADSWTIWREEEAR